MKKKFMNQIKRHGVIIWLVTVVVLLAVGVSLAAYTSFNSVKRVVSTGKASNILFGSNYLSLVGIDDTQYSTRRISPSEAEGSCTFTVLVCNYVYGNPTSWNTKDITYDFTVKVQPISGDTLPDSVADINVKQGDNTAQYNSNEYTFSFSIQTLSKVNANAFSYTITVPSILKDKIKFEIVATPNGDSKVATNSQKLAANITLSTLEPTQDWTGKFIDDKTNGLKPSDYDAFNYEIFGNGAGTVTLEWNSDVLQASKWFINEHGSVSDSEEGFSSISFIVGDSSDSPTAYQLQFYKVPGATIPVNWSTLDGYVTVSFTAMQSGS